MRNFVLLSFFLFIIHCSFCQEQAPEKYEYVILRQNFYAFQPRYLEIIYADGTSEKFADLAITDAGKNLNKNLSILLSAFNFLGNKGY